MRDVFTRTWFRSWGLPIAMVTVAVAVVLGAPLASPNPAGAKVAISGARSLSDQVSVTYSAKKQGQTTDVHLLAFNDLHGNLRPNIPSPLVLYSQYAGGAAFLAKEVKARQALYGDNEATLFAGDNIGASPLENGLYFEEPVTIAANLMHVDFASVGNHEFDKGKDELRRIQNGGCRPVEGCTAAPYALPDGGTTNVYPGADFQYLSANVVVDETGETLFPAYGTKRFKSDSGKKFEVGFIGETLEGTPTIVTPTGVAGLTFQDEADAANDVVEQAKKVGKHVGTWVLVIHEGGFQSAPAALNGCNGNLANSAIADIASRLDPAIKVIVSAHTHAEYRCTITSGGVTRLITSASSFGRILTDITLTIDDKSGELMAASATNELIDNASNAPPPPPAPLAPAYDPAKADPQVQALVDQYVNASVDLRTQVIGSIQGPLTRTATAFGESTLGDVIADAQLAATAAVADGDADFALMNPGGIRGDLTVAGPITYEQAYGVQPFGNILTTKTMTGDMIRRLLQQQFALVTGSPPSQVVTPCNGGTAPAGGRVLQVSSTFKYESAPTAATCADKIGRMWVNGVEVTPTMTFRVTMNNFLAFGGDGFTVFTEGTNSQTGDIDLDALVAYFDAAKPAGVAVPALGRIVAKP